VKCTKKERTEIEQLWYDAGSLFTCIVIVGIFGWIFDILISLGILSLQPQQTGCLGAIAFISIIIICSYLLYENLKKIEAYKK